MESRNLLEDLNDISLEDMSKEQIEKLLADLKKTKIPKREPKTRAKKPEKDKVLDARVLEMQKLLKEMGGADE